MRITLLLNRDIESNLCLNFLARQLSSHSLSVFLSDRVGGGKSVVPASMLGQLRFVEQDLWNDLVFPSLGALSECRPEARLLGFDEFEKLGIPVQRIASVRSSEGLRALQDRKPDLFVSIRFGRILGADAIAIPRIGTLNLHSGLLPNYQGVLATFRALLNGDALIGCTLHWIDSPQIDSGPIIGSASMAVDPQRSLLAHILALYPLGLPLIVRAIDQLDRGEPVPAMPSKQGDGAYFSFPNDADLLRFTSAGWRLFDPEDVHDLLSRYGLRSTAHSGNGVGSGHRTTRAVGG